MSHYTDQDRVIAFAGIYQAATLVHQLATQGQSDTTALTATLNSLFVDNPPDTISVFGGLDGIKLGLRTLRIQMSDAEALGEKRNMQITQYVIGMMSLESKLKSNSEMEEMLFRRLETPKSQSKHFGLLHDNTAAGIALIYSETLSRMRPKILVQGAHGHLSQPLVANRIRACLLAGVRAARLWRQTGGTRWHLIFARGRYLRAIDQALSDHREKDRQETQ
jgi:high frequency lysogenization protein